MNAEETLKQTAVTTEVLNQAVSEMTKEREERAIKEAKKILGEINANEDGLLQNFRREEKALKFTKGRLDAVLDIKDKFVKGQATVEDVAKVVFPDDDFLQKDFVARYNFS